MASHIGRAARVSRACLLRHKLEHPPFRKLWERNVRLRQGSSEARVMTAAQILQSVNARYSMGCSILGKISPILMGQIRRMPGGKR